MFRSVEVCVWKGVYICESSPAFCRADPGLAEKTVELLQLLPLVDARVYDLGSTATAQHIASYAEIVEHYLPVGAHLSFFYFVKVADHRARPLVNVLRMVVRFRPDETEDVLRLRFAVADVFILYCLNLREAARSAPRDVAVKIEEVCSAVEKCLEWWSLGALIDMGEPTRYVLRPVAVEELCKVTVTSPPLSALVSDTVSKRDCDCLMELARLLGLSAEMRLDNVEVVGLEPDRALLRLRWSLTIRCTVRDLVAAAHQICYQQC